MLFGKKLKFKLWKLPKLTLKALNFCDSFFGKTQPLFALEFHLALMRNHNSHRKGCKSQNITLRPPLSHRIYDIDYKSGAAKKNSRDIRKQESTFLMHKYLSNIFNVCMMSRWCGELVFVDLHSFFGLSDLIIIDDRGVRYFPSRVAGVLR